jgi:hypothetical protein
MSMEQVVGGAIGEAPSLFSGAAPVALRRIFESEEVGFFHLALRGAERVVLGHDRLVSVVLSLEGRAVLVAKDKETRLEPGTFAVVEEGQRCVLAGRGSGAKMLLFLGLDQLPGAFFNSFGPAHVQDG